MPKLRELLSKINIRKLKECEVCDGRGYTERVWTETYAPDNAHISMTYHDVQCARCRGNGYYSYKHPPIKPKSN